MSKDIKPRGRPKMTWNHCPKETIPFSLPPPNDVRKYIIVGGFKYSYKDRCRYKCTQPGCNSIANTVFKDGKVFKVISVTKHDHTKTANKIQIKKKGLLLNESSLKSNREILPYDNSYELRRMKYNISNTVQIPKTFHDMVIENVYPMVLSNCENTIVIGQISSVLLVSMSKEVYIDGTFKIVGNMKGQLLVIHGLVNGLSMSLLFIKMNSKEYSEYIKVMKMLYHLGLRLNVQMFNERMIIKCDYEIGLINAIKDVFPQVRISGCLFHMKQAINNYCNKLKFNNSRDQFEILRSRIVNIALLPLEFINNSTIKILFEGALLHYKNKHDSEVINSFRSYLNKTWLTESSSFPPSLWNISDVNTRTNNYSESANSFIVKKVDGQMPISVIIDSIISVMVRDKYKFLRNEKSGKDITIEKNKQFSFIKDLLKDNKIDFVDYLDIVCEIFKCDNMNDIENLKSDFFNDKRFKQYSNSPILKEQIEGAYALREYIRIKRVKKSKEILKLMKLIDLEISMMK